MDEQQLQHSCVPNALRDAWTWELKTKRPSRVALFHLEEGVDHSQAMGQLPSGEWIYLTTHSKTGNTLMSFERHFPTEPYRFLSLDEFIDEQKKVRNSELEGN